MHGCACKDVLMFPCCVLLKAMVKKGQLLRKQLNEKTRKAMEFNLFKQGLKASGVQDATLSPSQVADQLKKSLSASKELHSLLENMVEKRKKVRQTQVHDILTPK